MMRFFLGSLNQAGPYFHATGEGLTTCTLEESSGSIARIQVCPEVENVIWMTRTGDLLFVATERYLNPGEVAAFALTGTDIPIRVGRPQSSHGGAVCHLAVGPNAATAYVASYLGGLSVHAVSDQGEIAAAHQRITYQGSGPNSDRQEQSHPHQAVVSPDGRQLFVCDLGADKIWLHSINGNTLGPAHGMRTVSGCGPRHLAFHPRVPRVYLLGELDANVHVYDFLGDELHFIASHSSLPPGFNGLPAGAAIKFHPSGKALLVSNRGSDTITVFSVNEAGDLETKACFSTMGNTPRDFAVSPSGRWLLAVNQDSHCVMPFELNPDSGLPTGRYGPSFTCGSPVCAVF